MDCSSPPETASFSCAWPFDCYARISQLDQIGLELFLQFTSENFDAGNVDEVRMHLASKGLENRIN